MSYEVTTASIEIGSEAVIDPSSGDLQGYCPVILVEGSRVWREERPGYRLFSYRDPETAQRYAREHLRNVMAYLLNEARDHNHDVRLA